MWVRDGKYFHGVLNVINGVYTINGNYEVMEGSDDEKLRNGEAWMQKIGTIYKKMGGKF